MIVHNLLNAWNFVYAHWHQIVGFSILGVSISAILQYLKRRTGIDKAEVKLIGLIRLDGPRIVVLVQTLLVALGTLYAHLLDPTNAKYIPTQFAFLLMAVFYLHRFLVSPEGSKIEKELEPYVKAFEQVQAQKLADEAAAKLQAQSASQVVAPQTETVATPPAP